MLARVLALLRIGGIASWFAALIPWGGIVASVFKAIGAVVTAIVDSAVALLKDPAAYLAVGICSLFAAWSGIEFADRMHDRSQASALTAEKRSNEACHADLKEARAYVAAARAEAAERERLGSGQAPTAAGSVATSSPARDAPARPAVRRVRAKPAAGSANSDNGSWLQGLTALLPKFE